MKDIISITEMAKLRKITTETLRHYDRIGLVKPFFVDPDTGYRYYHITQYEKIGTIRELKNLGMSLKEIRDFFDNRNVENSKKIMHKQKKKIDQQLSELLHLRKEINRKIHFLNTLSATKLTDEISLKKLDARKYISFRKTNINEIELSYDCVQLEGLLKESKQQLPIFGTNRYGNIILKSDIENQKRPLPSKVMIQYEEESGVDEKNIIEFPAGEYLCMFYVGNFWNREESIQKLLDYMKTHNLRLSGDVLQMQWIDIAISDDLDEISYEFQAPVEYI